MAEVSSPARVRLEVFVVATGALLVSLSQSLLVPVLPILPEKLHQSAANIEWLLTSTLLVGAVAVPLFGRLGDMFGKRRMLTVAVAALTAGSLLDAVTSNFALLIVGRAMQGVSLAGIPLGISLLSALLPREKVPSAIALISAMLGVGGALGLPLAGVIGEHADFHMLFWITAGAGAAVLAGIVSIVPEAPSRSGGRIDVVGSVLLSAVLVCLLLPLAQTSSWGWVSARTLGLLAAAVVLLVVFVRFELRSRSPLVDVRATARKPIVLTNVASVLFGFALFASLIGTASYVEAPAATGYGFDSSIVVGGLTLLPSGLAMLFVAPISARLISRYGGKEMLALGALILSAGWVVRIGLTSDLWMIVAGSTVIGIGTSVGYAAMPTLINHNTPMTELAAANGLNSLARSLGTSLASALGGSILVASTVVVGGVEFPSLTAYRTLFVACAVAGVIAAVAAMLIDGSTRDVRPETATVQEPSAAATMS